MIPSTTNKLLVAEDWTKIYESYRNADFESYDFETLRRTMITYLRENYPEDFNDYIDSSEYIALIDLIAYLGQNISFRIDLNARENFLETAQRRDSVLRLARLISYNAKRNIPANGFLKILAVSTNDNVTDVNGNNLAGAVINWNDPTNTNWYQQFISVINSAMPGSFVFGRPYDLSTIDAIEHHQYRINSSNTNIPVYSFNANISGTQMNFEVVSSSFANKTYVYEEAPKPATQFSFIYKNDNQGNASANTGFFVHFREGALSVQNFNVVTPVPNAIVSVNAPDVNNSDTWLWQLDVSGNYSKLWTKVNDFVGNNVIYNSVNNSERNIYGISTRENDQIDINFSDGSFGNLPKGQFAFFYRQSNGLNYVIKPQQLNNIRLSIPYVNKNGQSSVLTIICSLQTTVSNSSASETTEQIKLKAPQNYYLQNRMITAEDYNIAPLTAGNDILKIKSINRISSGVSKYFELSDVSGKYSSTNIFANDGILYRSPLENSFNFNFFNESDIIGIIDNQLSEIVTSAEMRSLYLDQYPRINASGTELTWTQAQKNTNQTNGYFKNLTNPVPVGEYTDNDLKYVVPGSLIKFIPPAGYYFLPNRTLTSVKDSTTRNYIWSKVVGVIGDGFNNGLALLSTGAGPITLTGTVPDGAVVSQIIPAYASILSTAIKSEIVKICTSKQNFGLSFDSITRAWYIVSTNNVNFINAFSLVFQKDVSNTNKDSSWFVSFEWTGMDYRVRYRTLDYLFESVAETAFYVDSDKKSYDFVNNTVIKDQIKVLSINNSISTPTSAEIEVYSSNDNGSITGFSIVNSGTGYLSTPTISVDGLTGGQFYPIITNGSITGVLTIDGGTGYTTGAVTVSAPDAPRDISLLGVDYRWQINSATVEPDGFINPSKVKISFFDADENGQIDDPDAFNNIVQPDSVSLQTAYNDKFVFFKYLSDGQRYQVATDVILSYPTEQPVTDPVNGQLYYFYAPDINVIKRWSADAQEYVLEPDYFAYYGRSNLKFHYLHNSGEERRIDPSKTNLIDVYLLTRSYDTEYRNWLTTRIGSEPTPPTSSSLEENFASGLEQIKSISDELIFQPTRYKVLFGNLADLPLQGTFKAVRSGSSTASSNDLKTRIIAAVEEFFSIDNWDFGDTFYFSELSTYVMNKLTPDITNFIVVPNSIGTFGSLYEVTCQSNEIFVSGATVSDIEIIDAITASQLKTSGSIVTNTNGQ